MTRSTMSLHLPLAKGGDWLEDVAYLCWPSYRRTSLALGGDVQATFKFSAPDAVMEQWFADYLGAHFVETYEGLDAFQGYVHSLYYSHQDDVDKLSLDGVYNKIAVKYKTSSSATAAVTAFASDAKSIAKYGTRTLVYDLGKVYVNSTTAAAVRDGLLAGVAWPIAKNESVGVRMAKGRSILSVTVRGYAETLDGVLLKDTSTSTVNASVALTAALTGADFVTAGQVTANTAQVSEEVDYVGAWQRVKGIAKLPTTGKWLAGCYQGRSLDYFQPDLDTALYFLGIADKQKRLFLDAGLSHEAALPLVKPGRMAFRNYMAGRSVDGTLQRDPRAFFVERVEYSKNGLALKGTDSTGLAQAVALDMALAGAE